MTQCDNLVELYIGIFKNAVLKDLNLSNCPMRRWDYYMERRCLIHNVLPRDLFQLEGNNASTATFQFGWYDCCYFREESGVQFPFQKRKLGQVLGPLRNKGNEMTQAVLTINDTVVPCQTCAPLSVFKTYSKPKKTKR